MSTEEAAQAAPFALAAPGLSRAGYSPITVMPGEKAPGIWDGRSWRLASGWTTFRDAPLTGRELAMRATWPDANVGVLAGTPAGSHRLVMIDFDADGQVLADLAASIPESPMRKCGGRGHTGFYRADAGVRTRSFKDETRQTLVEILSGNATRQSVVPPSLHPSGRVYEWLGVGIVPAADLPILTAVDFASLEAAAARHGWSREAHHPVTGEVQAPRTASSLEGEVTIWRELNAAALANLSAWVPDLGLYRCRPRSNGYEAVADWRPSGRGVPLHRRKTNLKMHTTGIKDMGTDDRYAPLDLVMKARGIGFNAAYDWLFSRVGSPIDLGLDKITCRTVHGRSK